MTLYEKIFNENKFDLSRPALYYEEKTISYEALFSNVKKMMSFFSSIGIKRRDTVTVVLPNIPATIYTFYALNALGVVQNIIHPLSKIEQIIQSMKDTKSQYAIVLATEYQDNIEKIEQSGLNFIFTNPMFDNSLLMRHMFYFKYKKIKRSKNIFCLDDYTKYSEYESIVTHDSSVTSILLHSGGTTGIPKIIELSDDSINNLVEKVPYIVSGSLEGKSMLAVLPTFHGFGLGMGIHAPLANKATSALMMKFNSHKIIKWINQNKVNFIIGVPLLYQKLLKEDDFKNAKLQNLEYCFVGGDNVQKNLIEEFNELMKKNNSICRLLEGYGLTETVTVCNVNTLNNFKLGSVGKGLKGIEIIIKNDNDQILSPNEIGEVYIHGNTIMNGYYLDRTSTEKTIVEFNNKKWVKTGDLGYLDEDGFLFLKGRKKRMFKLSGINIYPLEVEKMALENYDVFDAAMEFFSEPKPHTILFIILNKNTTKSSQEIIEALESTFKQKLIKYLQPTKIVVLNEFPKTLVGKVDHSAFKDS